MHAPSAPKQFGAQMRGRRAVRWEQVMKQLLLCTLASLSMSEAAGAAELNVDIAYAIAGGENLKLDASVPDGAGPFPVAILVHGGGWAKGDKSQVFVPPTGTLTESKFTWFSIEYRLAPRHLWPAQIDDVRQAIRWVKQHAAQYKGDPQRIAIIGYSAGGHLAALAAVTADDDTRMHAAVVYAGPTDLLADSERHGGVTPALQNLFGRGPRIDAETRTILRVSSPISHVRAGLPPFLLVHGTQDESVLHGQSEKFKARLDELGVPCELLTIPGATHDIVQWGAFDRDYEQKVVAWLREVLAR